MSGGLQPKDPPDEAFGQTHGHQAVQVLRMQLLDGGAESSQGPRARAHRREAVQMHLLRICDRAEQHLKSIGDDSI